MEEIEKELGYYPFMVATQTNLTEALNWFQDCKHGILIANIRSLATGWRAPKDAIILFTGSIEDGPHKIQAMARKGFPR